MSSMNWFEREESGMTSKDVADYYSSWANSFNYEHKIMYTSHKWRYNGAKLVMKYLGPHLTTINIDRVLDVGAGSGNVGEEVGGSLGMVDFLRTQNGVDRSKQLRPYLGENVSIDCLEPSDGMRKAAQNLMVYNNFYTDYVHGLHSTSVKSNTYDLVCGIGCFQPCHIEPHGLLEMLRLVKIGGIAVVGLRQLYLYEDQPYPARFRHLLQNLDQNPAVQKLEQIRDIDNWDTQADGVEFKGAILIYKKLSDL